MSGILGVWNSPKTTPWQKMLEDLKVLGSDGQGDWHDRSVGLSLGRAQFFNTPESCLEPPVVESEGCVLVWDGRLDDRDSLRLGRSDVTDAQLIIESYRRWGVACLSCLTGEFAFILWDASLDLLFVGCDRVGGRTLAYYWDGQVLLLSSRVLTLLLHPQVSHELDPLYLAHTLCSFWAHPPGLTPFAKIERLRPGFALTLQSGQLQQQQVARFARPDRYESPRSPSVYYEKFWHLLNQSVKDRLRTYRPVCTTLSGGLDSTTVTASVLNHLPAVDAFSIVTEVFSEFNERQPIESFLQRYPQIRWHEVNCDRAWAFSEPWESLPVTDDPLVACTLPMNLKVIERVQAQGFGLMFDGEGGDEIFYTSLQDLARASSWSQALNYLSTYQAWHSVLWREFALPRLPKYWRQKWFARWQRHSNPIPPWIKIAYSQTPPMRIALQQYFESLLSNDLMRTITWSIESSGSVGSCQVYRLMNSAHRLESTSPLQDRRLVEFSLNLHPSLQNDPVHSKVFLRQANRHSLPEEVLWRSKINHFGPLRDLGLARGNQVLEMLEQSSSLHLLEEIINFEQVNIHINLYRQKKNQDQGIANMLYELFSFICWYQRVQANYL
jgi:asparagine synthase (glutamine-hydrolysing)